VTTTQSPVTTIYPTRGYYYPKSPNVFIRPNSQPEEKYLTPTISNGFDQPAVPIPNNNDLSSVQSPSVVYLPPFSSDDNSRTQDEANLPPLAYYPSSTPLPPLKDESDLPPIAYYPSSTANPLESNSVIPLASTPAPISVKHLSNGFVTPREYGVVPIGGRSNLRSSYRSTYRSTERPADYYRNSIDASYGQRNVPLFDRSKYQQQQQQSSYDGVGVTANGFRYFLPRQYEEQVTNKDGSRDGSFGYIDPFGIRRVVYYNAGSNGFVHRKNNRYVGFNATPYDPRPN